MNDITKTAAIAIAAMLAAAPALATNGYFTHGNGSKSKGLAGAGSAQPGSAIDLSINPASALLVGDRIEIGTSLFSPRRNYKTTTSQANGKGGAFTIGPNESTSEREGFVIPHIARTWANQTSAFGLAFYGRGGMNTAWQGGTASFDPDGPGPAPVTTLDGAYGGGAAGVDLAQAFLDLAYARRISSKVVVGASAVLAVQNFEATGVGSFAPFTASFARSGGTALPQNLSDRGHDVSWGGGLRLGLNSQLTSRARFALAYQSKIYMTEFDDYADLFAGAGDFDIPASVTAGLSLDIADSWRLHVDVERTWYSDVDAVGNPISNLFDCPTAGAGGTDVESCLGGSRGAGFGWDDMTTVKIGAEWRASDNWTWRAGLSHGEQPIPESEVTFNILAPGVVEDHVTFGFTRRVGEALEVSGAIMYAPDNTVSGTNTFDPTQTIELEMHQFEFELSVGWRL